MPDDRHSEKQIEAALVDRRRAQGFDDLQNEIAGRDVGRNARFLGKDRDGISVRGRRSLDDAIELTALQKLLNNDPVYAERYYDVLGLLDRAQSATEIAIENIEAELDTAQAELVDMKDNANRLPDGTLVFQGEDGNVRTADGRILDDEECDSIVWKDDSPLYEAFIRQQQSVHDLIIQLDNLRTYQIDVIGTARDKISDPDNPPSMDDLDRIEDDIRSKAPEVIRDQIEPKVAPSNPDNSQSFDVDIPKL